MKNKVKNINEECNCNMLFILVGKIHIALLQKLMIYWMDDRILYVCFSAIF